MVIIALTTMMLSHGSLPTPAQMFPLSAVRLLPSPFTKAVEANRKYVLALDADRLLAPFRREAGLKPRKESYGNWESMGLDGHTGGHYLSALADMIASGDDTKDHEMKRRLDYMVDELAECQKASGDGYIGGVPGSKELWAKVAAGQVEAVFDKWVPWYNLHKTFAGLRDAYEVAGNQRARDVLVKYADWACKEISGLSDEQMQRMMTQEHGGMNEVLADVYAITGDEKYLTTAKKFSHEAILDPLENHQDKLTGLHANTQIPKVIGFEKIASLDGDQQEDSGARFFWDRVTQHRSVAFGGNSVSEHFNDPKDFQGMLEHREGPETCNTYNMLRLTEGLFATDPVAKYADFYERALYNHILASIDPEHPGYVYFTPIRPEHYRVYSTPGESFWCCVGTGMENPGRYGQFIYAKAKDGLYVNLFIPSELKVPGTDLVVRQETKFPDEERTMLTLHMKKPMEYSLILRHPGWVSDEGFVIKVNGKKVDAPSKSSSYIGVRRQWHDGDKVELSLPMRTTVEELPDQSDWYAILHGPIVLVHPSGTEDQTGLHAGAGRGDHIAQGPVVPLDKAPVLITWQKALPTHVVPDPSGGPLHFRLTDVVEPTSKAGLSLVPFFRLQESRYQMYWEVMTSEGFAERQKRLAEEEKAKLAREAATLDSVAVGEQQPEVDHQMKGEGLETGFFNGRRWRHGKVVQYTLNPKGFDKVDLAVTYSGGDNGRTFDIFVNDHLISTQALVGDKPGKFFEVRYPIPAEALAAGKDGMVTVRFVAKVWLAGGFYDVRLLKR
ncbi:MAG: glycoside hydrolase family 127 protein [Armatimonadetes bacterium]|nr:glycoside hydrolase family 127 protein [Armatimonadota bacterium]